MTKYCSVDDQFTAKALTIRPGLMPFCFKLPPNKRLKALKSKLLHRWLGFGGYWCLCILNLGGLMLARNRGNNDSVDSSDSSIGLMDCQKEGLGEFRLPIATKGCADILPINGAAGKW
jgi:hypothetical protein